MKSLNYSLEYKKIEDEKIAYPVIIVAAGTASRMKGIDKIGASVCGLPVICHTVLAFDRNDNISQVVVVTRKEKIDEYTGLLDNCKLQKKITVVEGGSCREESVYKGIKALCGGHDKVVIHDGARPIVSNSVINRVCDALRSCDSVTCGVKMKDTVKTVNEDMQVVKTLQREFLVSVQTPQAVSVEKFAQSANINDLSRFTDDTSVVEAVGCNTVVVEGDYKNIKITTPEDIKLAEIYLSRN